MKDNKIYEVIDESVRVEISEGVLCILIEEEVGRLIGG
jgi:hypothetical protein